MQRHTGLPLFKYRSIESSESLQSHFIFHCTEQVKGLQRSQIVQVGIIQIITQILKQRVFKLEKRQLKRAVALHPAFLDIMRLGYTLP